MKIKKTKVWGENFKVIEELITAVNELTEKVEFIMENTNKYGIPYCGWGKHKTLADLYANNKKDGK